MPKPAVTWRQHTKRAERPRNPKVVEIGERQKKPGIENLEAKARNFPKTGEDRPEDNLAASNGL
jgi:hypothetical protein